MRAVSATGAVITSAGIVLAAVFCVLGVLPLIVLTQVGIIVGLGILFDTFVVRTVMIPALFTLIGPRIWWPAFRNERLPFERCTSRWSTPCSGGFAVRTRGSRRGDDVLAQPVDDRRMWTAQADHFSKAIRSSWSIPRPRWQRKADAAFTFDECARCIVDILDSLGVERTHFIGNSWGGMIGGTFAATIPTESAAPC